MSSAERVHHSTRETPPNRAEQLRRAAQDHRFPDLPPSSQTQHSDLFKDFSQYLFFLKNHGRQVAREETKKMLSGNLLSIAKEMKGRQWMQTAFKTKKNKERTIFQRSEFKGGEDLRAYSTTIDETITNPNERERFRKENQQMVDIFDTFEQWLADVEWSDDAETVINQLTALKDGNHFVETTLPVTKELEILFPQLRQFSGQNLRVFVSRAMLSVSPTSPVHAKRQTSLAWVNKLVYIPDLHELVMVRDGIFSGYNDEEIAEFLTLDQDWNELTEQSEHEINSAADYFQTEAELFEFLAFLPEEYKNKHAHVILEEVIKRLGGFKAAPKIANVSDELTIDVEAMSEVLVNIFEWELLTYGQDEAAAPQVAERLNYLKNNFLHQIATDTTINWQQAFKHYTTFFGQRQKAVDPENYVEEAQQAYSRFYPKLAQIKIDLSVLDCGVGTVIGGFNNLSLDGLSAAIGMEGISLLRKYEHRAIQTQSELIEFCRQFQKDHRRFDHWGECRTCHHDTFLGECDICPVCEVKDDLGIRSLKELGGFNSEKIGSLNGTDIDNESDGSTTLGIVVASLATRGVLEEHSWSMAA